MLAAHNTTSLKFKINHERLLRQVLGLRDRSEITTEHKHAYATKVRTPVQPVDPAWSAMSKALKETSKQMQEMISSSPEVGADVIEVATEIALDPAATNLNIDSTAASQLVMSFYC